MNEHLQPQLPPRANPPPLPGSCLKLEAFSLQEQVGFPFPSHRNHDRPSGLEDSFLTVSSSSWAVSEGDLQQMCCRLNKLQCSLSLWGVITSHTPPVVAKPQRKGGKENMSLQHSQGKSSHSTSAKFYSFGHSHFTVMWWLSCPWGELISPTSPQCSTRYKWKFLQ